MFGCMGFMLCTCLGRAIGLRSGVMGGVEEGSFPLVVWDGGFFLFPFHHEKVFGRLGQTNETRRQARG